MMLKPPRMRATAPDAAIVLARDKRSALLEEPPPIEEDVEFVSVMDAFRACERLWNSADA